MITDSGLSVNVIRVKKQIESLVVFQRELLHLTHYLQFPGYFKNHLQTITSSIYPKWKNPSSVQGLKCWFFNFSTWFCQLIVLGRAKQDMKSSRIWPESKLSCNMKRGGTERISIPIGQLHLFYIPVNLAQSFKYIWFREVSEWSLKNHSAETNNCSWVIRTED